MTENEIPAIADSCRRTVSLSANDLLDPCVLGKTTLSLVDSDKACDVMTTIVESESRNCVGAYMVACGDIRFFVKVIRAPDSESEFLPEVVRKYPSIEIDSRSALPLIAAVVDPESGNLSHYLHITKWIHASGTLTDMILTHWSRGEFGIVTNTIPAFGKFLREWHMSYPSLQHNDMNPSNVLVTHRETDTHFVLVDCAGLDYEVGDDCRTFLASLQVLADGGFGSVFYDQTSTAFTTGYTGSSVFE